MDMSDSSRNADNAHAIEGCENATMAIWAGDDAAGVEVGLDWCVPDSLITAPTNKYSDAPMVLFFPRPKPTQAVSQAKHAPP